ncbi:MAG: class II aldolase/adducin family protein [Candidatus Binatia bacterium]|jgi:L-fuculose-phosphate aldolase|nr:class II aldolase/adducin family protein [Candidatus Binatia bacterium]
MDLDALKEKVAYSCNILAIEGHWDNILGHVSVRIPGENAILMKPHSFGFEEIRPYHLIVCDLDGNKIRGDFERHSEVFIHTGIYKARPDVHCVVHTHPPYATAFASLRQPLRPISHEGSIFHEGLPLFDYTTLLIRSPELGAKVAESLGKCRGLLMKNHGSTVVGETVEVATLHAVFLEKAARIQLLATASGEPSWSSDEEARTKYDQVYTAHRLGTMWDYFVRRAKRAVID